MTKVVLVTGTSSGLGLSSAVMLAKEGFKVFATMRNLEKKSVLISAAEKAGVELEVLALDVVDNRSIQQAVAAVIDQEGRIDILINNAGAGFAKNIEQASESEVQWVTDVNYFGVVRCTQAVLPHMRAAGSGHIINISSVGGLVGQPFNELYCAAKFAVEGFTESLATILPQYFGIHLTIIEPGGISTEFGASASQVTLGDLGIPDDAYAPIFQRYLEGFQQRTGDEDNAAMVYQTPEEVANIVVQVIRNPNPPLRLRTSPWADELTQFKTASDPDGTKQLSDVVSRFLGES